MLPLFGLVFVTTSVFANDAPVSLDEALLGAQAITVMEPGLLFISKPDVAYACSVTVSPEFFSHIAARRFDEAKAMQPSAICVPTYVFELLGND